MKTVKSDPKTSEPFDLLNVNIAVFLLLSESFNFQYIDDQDMPGGCDCGNLHLLPPIEMLVESESWSSGRQTRF